ncbi:glycosyltransferase [Paenibacillus farraposensis]|uniref:Glycosyltransferase n=2 Tax=Paenibacillus farraposensis TaxID=2807095 RepID=A0ABW4DE00_9BACL|nr:glycosyltransferase [Paenibacillus farraposensis]MCC3380764.1 glycosyltransferase [Paenibacillus farraposensis]
MERIRRFKPYRLSGCGRPNIRVACIMDAFSYACFKYECKLMHLNVSTWRRQIQYFKPNLLLVESAWQGLDRSWRRQLYDIGGKRDVVIREIIRFCRKNGIPTVFWNKEDSPNYKHFISTAKLFDYVFTTDANCIKRYRRDLGHDRIDVLPFAAQPVLHNPVDTSYHSKENVAFAGTWYRTKYPHRPKDMSLILGPARSLNLHIFDRKRNYRINNVYKFPKIYRPYIVGSLPYEEMVEAYKLYKVFLNVNSVKDSPTMFSRRVFEILAAGTNVISTYSLGIETMFSGIVPIAGSVDETNALLHSLLHNAHYSERLSLLGLREVHLKHLYRHRFDQILKTLGIAASPHKGVAIIACQDQYAYLDGLLNSFHNQALEHKELILLFDETAISEKQVKELQSKPNVVLHLFSEETPFDERIGLAIRHTGYDFVALMNGTDYYAAHFLTDLMHAFHYTDATIVGKLTRYLYLETRKQLMLVSPDKENQYVERLSGEAMIIKKQVLSEISLRGRTNEEFERFFSDCRSNGMKMFAADKFNYIRIVKKSDESSLSGDEVDIKTTTAVSCSGDHLAYATV